MFILIAHKKKIEVLIHKLRIVKVLTLFTYTSYVTLANTLDAVIEQRTNNFLRTQLDSCTNWHKYATQFKETTMRNIHDQ